MIVEPLLGTRAEVAVTSDDPEVERSAETAVVVEARRLEHVFSRFDETSALHDYRRFGTSVIPELIEVIGLADEWQQRTGGAFHPAVQPLVDLWDRAERRGTPPSAGDMQHTIESMTPERTASSLDLNAIAKGWIADAALMSSLESLPDASAGWFNVGGDIVHRGAGSIAVGIEDPSRPYDNVAPLATIELSNEALATSGGAHRWWAIAGVRYPKVIDPRTGRPGQRMTSATVVAADGATADALATIAVFLDPAETLGFAADVGADCFLVHPDGSTTSSSGRFRPS